MANITRPGASSAKQVAAEEAEPMKVEVVVGAEDDLNGSEADLDARVLGLEADEAKCRSIRRQYRQLICAVQRRRQDFMNTASDSLSEALQEANALFHEVSRPREAALDAQFLVLVSDLGKEKAQQLSTDLHGFNQVAFGDLLCVFAGRNLTEGTERGGPRGCDAGAARFWETVRKEAACWTRRAETFHFVYGSFKPEPSARKPRREPQKMLRLEDDRDMPVKLRKLDLSNNQEGTEKEVERILGLLQMYFRKYPDTPVSYFEFVIDPNSFSRTVENIFYVSFIIRDGFARITLDQDRLPILEPTNINQMGERSDPSSNGRRQGIISMSLQDWRNIVATFEISEAMITNSC